MMLLPTRNRLSLFILLLSIINIYAFQLNQRSFLHHYASSINDNENKAIARDGVAQGSRRRISIGVFSSQIPLTTQTDDAAKNNFEEEDDRLTTMRQEIEQLRAEALQKVEALSKEAEQVEEVLMNDATRKKPKNLAQLSDDETNPFKVMVTPSSRDKQRAEEEVWKKNPPRATTTPATSSTSTNLAVLGKPMPMQVEKNNDLELLDHTHWKIMLNIGRDPSTWMPKTWGISGARMLLNLELCFEADQLYEREEFLQGVGNAKVCRVVHHELNIAPTLTEGSKKITLKDGGWRIVKGTGPLGTDLLRFYIETETEIRQGDVHVPPGRIYCTCGYFVMHRPSGIKDYLRDQMSDMEERIEKIRDDLQEEGVFSMKRMKLSKELFDLGWKEAELKKAMNEAAVVEPDKSLLRISRKGDVGLTREGGVCCKVKKGPVMEYHILGRFSVAAIEPREEM